VALAREAFTEAVAHLGRGLDVLGTLPEGSERTQRELSLQLALGNAWLVAKGYGAPEARAAYARARELAAGAGDSAQVVQVLIGLWASAVIRGERATARTLADELLAVAEDERAQALLTWAHAIQGATRSYYGDVARGREHLERAIACYDASVQYVGMLDPGTFAFTLAVTSAWHLGFPDQARARLEQALAHARSLGRPYEDAFAQLSACGLFALLREPEPTCQYGEGLIALATEQQFPFFVANGKIFRGWALAQQGRHQDGVAEARDALAALVGAEQWFSLGNNCRLVAEAHVQAGARDEALRVVEDGLTGCTDEETMDSDLHRLHGDLLAAGGDIARAEASYRHAAALAHRHGARFFELRALAGLARLLRTPETRDALGALYASFTEGFDTRDLVEAKALLEELG
jgi:predicted ATPase